MITVDRPGAGNTTFHRCCRWSDCPTEVVVEISAQQSAKAREKIYSDVTADEEDVKVIGSVGTEKVKASCPQCNAPLAANAKFCPECGAKIQEKKFCAECGAALTPGAKFCPECGTKTAA